MSTQFIATFNFLGLMDTVVSLLAAFVFGTAIVPGPISGP
jgi:hypothetical protein